MDITRVGSFTLDWGESVVWDDRRNRLYFVDCMKSTLHWLEDGSDELHTVATPSMPTGVVPCDDGRLLVVLDDGLHLVDPDGARWELLTHYPDEIGGRCNDACADLDGHLITGKLNLGPAEGSAWWYSNSDGWRMLDPDIANTNGPTVAELDGAMTLIIGDTSAQYFSYPYTPSAGTVGARTVFGDVSSLDGGPDGATLDVDGGLWCALFDGGQLARFTTRGLERTVPMPMRNPTDVTFGGVDLDVLYVVSTNGPDDLAGALLRIDGLDVRGRPEPRFTVPTSGTPG
ncbi:MAG TPA: SMP-30/gluconolactonase/LRE family protein [Acidimicrobiales bacterium]|nr:SMP-30/gluconolactonase/LRE family protein [Acidimicrobiales bacterium]